jgi:hypothetical protein
MKTLNHILIAAAALLLTVGASQADEPRADALTRQNSALLSSPRYLEEHPELLRSSSAARQSNSVSVKQSVETPVNIALANSPRFREQHPEYRFATVSPARTIASRINPAEQLRRLTQNRALAANPRFREQHPELLQLEPSFEIAPIK